MYAIILCSDVCICMYAYTWYAASCGHPPIPRYPDEGGLWVQSVLRACYVSPLNMLSVIKYVMPYARALELM